MRHEVTLPNGIKMEMIELGTVKSLPTYSMVGGYPVFYMDGHDCVLCAECATESVYEYDGDDIRDLPVASDVNWESEMHCECGKLIEMAYPDDEEE